MCCKLLRGTVATEKKKDDHFMLGRRREFQRHCNFFKVYFVLYCKQRSNSRVGNKPDDLINHYLTRRRLCLVVYWL